MDASLANEVVGIASKFLENSEMDTIINTLAAHCPSASFVQVKDEGKQLQEHGKAICNY